MDEMVILESRSMRQQLCTDENTAVLDKVGGAFFYQEPNIAPYNRSLIFTRWMSIRYNK